MHGSMVPRRPALRWQRRVTPSILLLAGAALLTGCAATTVRRNLDDTAAFAAREVGVEARLNASAEARAAADRRVAELLAAPLSLDGAVEIALRYSPRFQQMLSASAAASAVATQAARLPNPLFEYGRLSAGGVVEIDRAVTVSLLDFVLLPQRRRLANQQQARLRLQSAADVVAMTADVRRAWIEAVAAEESVRQAERLLASAAAAAELGKRMAAAGNLSRLEWNRQQVFLADAAIELARARETSVARREALLRLLGLSGDLASALHLPERLPDLPDAPMPESRVAERTFADRLDVRLARVELDYTARSLGLTRVTSMVNGLDVAARNQGTTGEPTREGYGVEFRLPLFDFGDARRATAEATYLAALNHTARVGADAYSHVRQGYVAYRTAYDIARRYRDEVLPLRRMIADENLRRYNGMLISVFELLADAREQASSEREAIGALSDYWKADAALRAVLLGAPLDPPAAFPPVAPPGAAIAAPH
jgi:outer membrane protein TolC